MLTHISYYLAKWLFLCLPNFLIRMDNIIQNFKNFKIEKLQLHIFTYHPVTTASSFAHTMHFSKGFRTHTSRSSKKQTCKPSYLCSSCWKSCKGGVGHRQETLISAFFSLYKFFCLPDLLRSLNMFGCYPTGHQLEWLTALSNQSIQKLEA